MADDIQITDSAITDARDLNFLKMVEGAMLNSTVMPSGLRSPARDLMAHDGKLVDLTDAERAYFDAMKAKSAQDKLDAQSKL